MLTRVLPSAALALLMAVPAAAQAPDVIHLFDGKQFTEHFYSWLVDDHLADPDRVFTVVDNVDGAPAIRISGQKWGGITTRKEYETYHLVVEFRWGNLTWGNRKDRARDSGVLVHAQGRDGNTGKDFNGPWMHSIEAQIIEGGVGDFILVAGTAEDGSKLVPRMTATTLRDRTGELYYDPNGVAMEHSSGQRINWWGRDADWADKLGFVGVADVEGHGSEWTRLEVIVEKDRITNIVNGRVVNVGTRPSLSKGKIMIQSEGAELYVRRVDLYPVAKR
ncbi:hypothetical protein TBR22_A36400 [Luteitalea sp. TBR-22]|uniref:3-keto-disaccharide hydrolase n=1 Tax=Luteitalea sp. TBR-22 TaxID=2802971 RepID=UPI001AF8AB46|nr:DUF1080 domain-containing protein [Luteitalea sp. TBR-22]BCS34413.1 hypothetical protein TBR22_A36400 [Luteitalea sp. TBR-22]